MYWEIGHLDTWKRYYNQNSPTIRANLGLWAYPEANDDYQIAKLKELYSNDANSLMKVNQIKFYIDGLLQSTTAAELQRYKVDLNLPGLEDNIGMPK